MDAWRLPFVLHIIGHGTIRAIRWPLAGGCAICSRLRAMTIRCRDRSPVEYHPPGRAIAPIIVFAGVGFHQPVMRTRADWTKAAGPGMARSGA